MATDSNLKDQTRRDQTRRDRTRETAGIIESFLIMIARTRAISVITGIIATIARMVTGLIIITTEVRTEIQDREMDSDRIAQVRQAAEHLQHLTCQAASQTTRLIREDRTRQRTTSALRRTLSTKMHQSRTLTRLADSSSQRRRKNQ